MKIIPYALKNPYTLHVVAFDPRQPGAEATYQVTRHETRGLGEVVPRTPPHLWRTLSHALYRVGCDCGHDCHPKSDLKKTRDADIPEMLLDDVDLRTIGFSDV